MRQKRKNLRVNAVKKFCVNDLDIINEFINSLLHTPLKKCNTNENLYISLYNGIDTFLTRHKHIDKKTIRAILHLYAYSESDIYKPSLSNAINIIAMVVSVLSLSILVQQELKVTIPSYFNFCIQIVFFLVLGDLVYIEYCKHRDRKRLKILDICTLILQDYEVN